MNLSWLLPEKTGIPVLMYHNVLPGAENDLTITPAKLREQWLYLKQEGYKSLGLNEYLELLKSGHLPAQKSFLLTFDDGHLNNFDYAYPLLMEFGFKATFFIIADSLDPDGTDKFRDYGNEQPKMSARELAQLDPVTVQLAMHGYHHEHFDQLSLPEIIDVLKKSAAAFATAGLPYFKVLAYPYGARPKEKAINEGMKQWMGANGYEAAFRIGNQVCTIPATDKFEIKRIDIKGTDTLQQFRIKLKKGKLKPF